LTIIGIIMACLAVNAQENYVSPETYAVNDDDIRAIFQELMQPAAQTAQTPAQPIKYDPTNDKEKGVRATLRRIRYNHMNPYHGAKHEIKVNSAKK